jgi:hypothetical protein
MKTLPSITRGKYDFEVDVAHIAATEVIIRVTIKCGDDTLSGHMNHRGSHDYSEEQFAKDVNNFAQRLVDELAGTIRSRELAAKFVQG